MTLYYAASMGGFLSSMMHGKTIPEDAVEITPEQHRALLQANAQGARITADKQRRPIAVFPSEEERRVEQTKSIRAERNTLLAAYDWTQLSDLSPASLKATRALWAEYRQALRDVPQQPGFPDEVIWPVLPVA